MQEIVHLPEEIRAELRDAWERLLITPVQHMLERVLPEMPQETGHMVATFMIDMATFVGANEERFGRDALKAMIVAAAGGIKSIATPAKV
jgi:hypothetical protein